MKPMRGRTSLIATMLNEAESIEAWMQGIEQQTVLPDEIVVVDGGSTDGTLAALNAWVAPVALRIISAPGASIARGRNIAISKAAGEIVVVTDAGTIAQPEWIEHLLAAFEDPRTDVAVGFFVPRTASRWDAALAATTLPDSAEFAGGRFLPSSRSLAFRRAWFELGLRYPEWLDYCEDVVFDLALRRAGANFRFVPEAVVEFRVRPTFAEFWKQYYRYARGDGKAGLFPLRHAVRYATYVGLVLVVLRGRRLELLVMGLAGLAYLRAPVRRLRRRQAGTDPRTIGLTALLRMWGDLAKMVGYPVGIAWRLRHFGLGGYAGGWKRISPTLEQSHPE